MWGKEKTNTILPKAAKVVIKPVFFCFLFFCNEMNNIKPADALNKFMQHKRSVTELLVNWLISSHTLKSTNPTHQCASKMARSRQKA